MTRVQGHGPRGHRPRGHRARGSRLIAVVAAVVMLAGCGDDGPAASGGDTGFVPGDGLIASVPPDQREEPVTLVGTDSAGEAVDTGALRGQVVVVNLWYADCAPCRVEAADLEQVWQQTQDDGVAFVGINTRDDAARAARFEEQFGTTYPSIIDTDKSAVLALRGQVSPNALPSTLVLDTQGRVASRVSGIVTATTLTGLIEDAQNEAAPTE